MPVARSHAHVLGVVGFGFTDKYKLLDTLYINIQQEMDFEAT